MTTLVYIHGANATPASFNHMRSKVGDGIAVSYDSQVGFKNNLDRIMLELSGIDSMVLIGHSLGGVYAMHLANQIGPRVRHGITMGTPYGGHSPAYYAKLFMPFDNLIRDIDPMGWPMRHLNQIHLGIPWLQIVTTSGNVPWLPRENDGVVTLESQRHLKSIEMVEIPVNHYEVVQDDRVVNLIRKRLRKIQ